MTEIEKYKYGKIYTIVQKKENEEELIYIGSTFQKLNNKFVYHLESAKDETIIRRCTDISEKKEYIILK